MAGETDTTTSATETTTPAAVLPAAESTPKTETALPVEDKSLMNAEEPPAEGQDSVKAGEEDKKTPTTAAYEDFKTPEGFTVDEAKMTEFKEMAAESGLSQEQAQKLLDKHHEIVKETADQGRKLWDQLKTQWHSEINADPDIGGKNLPETKRQIAKLIDTIAGKDAKETRAAFDLTGAGDNPYVVRLLTKAARALGVSEGKPLPGTPGKQQQPRTAGSIMYPNQQGLGNSHLNPST